MTPKEKAIQLVESMTYNCRECDYEWVGKQCALNAVNEILSLFVNVCEDVIFYEKVKQEIEKL